MLSKGGHRLYKHTKNTKENVKLDYKRETGEGHERDQISWMKEGSDFMFLSTGREALSIFTPPSYLATLES